MEIYHGSLWQVKKPILSKGRASTDFGQGFYTTSMRQQAERWALNKKKDADGNAQAILNSYRVRDDLLSSTDYLIKIFEKPSSEWLAFVVACRRGTAHAYDLVFGPVADDKIYTTIVLYETGVLTAEETIARLAVKEYYNQLSFHTRKALQELQFVASQKIGLIL